jgi:hypothetical protein
MAFIVMIGVFMVSACALTTSQNVVTAELNLRQNKIAAATAASVLCQQGLMSAEDCATAAGAYQLSQISSSMALSMLLASCDDPALQAQIQEAVGAGFPRLSFTKVELK